LFVSVGRWAQCECASAPQRRTKIVTSDESILHCAGNPVDACAADALLAKEDFGNPIDLGVEPLQLPYCFRERHTYDPVAAQRDHLAPLSVSDHFVSFDSKPGGQN